MRAYGSFGNHDLSCGSFADPPAAQVLTARIAERGVALDRAGTSWVRGITFLAAGPANELGAFGDLEGAMVEFLLSLLVGLVVAAAFWRMLRTLAFRLAGLRGQVPADTGPVLRKSRWGDANVNGVDFENCVRVVECANGWLVQVRLIGGRLWMPRAQTRVGELEGVGQLTAPYRTLAAGVDRVKLEGELAEFIAEPAVAADGAGTTAC
jgi:hypothetical protein